MELRTFGRRPKIVEIYSDRRLAAFRVATILADRHDIERLGLRRRVQSGQTVCRSRCFHGTHFSKMCAMETATYNDLDSALCLSVRSLGPRRAAESMVALEGLWPR